MTYLCLSKLEKIGTIGYISYNKKTIKSSEKKNLFNAAATGNLEEITNLISRNPLLLGLHNKSTDKPAIYYAVKHGHTEVSTYLYEKGQRISRRDVESLIRDTKCPEKILEINDKLELFEFNRDQLFEKMKRNCYLKNNFTNLERLMKINSITDWGQIMKEYRECHPNNLNSRFVRDISLKYLIDGNIL